MTTVIRWFCKRLLRLLPMLVALFGLFLYPSAISAEIDGSKELKSVGGIPEDVSEYVPEDTKEKARDEAIEGTEGDTTYQPANGGPKPPSGDFDKEEDGLAKREAVLKPEKKPKLGIALDIGFQGLPTVLLGQPVLEVNGAMEWMYRPNFSLVLRGGMGFAFNYRGRKLLFDELMNENPGVSYYFGGFSVKAGGVSFGGGIGTRMRLLQKVEGFFIGAGINGMFYPVYGFEGGRAIPTRDDASVSRSVVSGGYLNAIVLTPHFEVGKTYSKSSLFFEIGGQFGIDAIFGRGEFIDVRSDRFELLEGDKRYNISEYPHEKSISAIRLSAKLKMLIGYRF